MRWSQLVLNVEGVEVHEYGLNDLLLMPYGFTMMIHICFSLVSFAFGVTFLSDFAY